MTVHWNRLGPREKQVLAILRDVESNPLEIERVTSDLEALRFEWERLERWLE